MLITELVTEGSVREMEELVLRIHAANPQSTLDEWIEAMSDQSKWLQRLMLSDYDQATFDLDIAVQVRLLGSSRVSPNILECSI